LLRINSNVLTQAHKKYSLRSYESAFVWPISRHCSLQLLLAVWDVIISQVSSELATYKEHGNETTCSMGMRLLVAWG